MRTKLLLILTTLLITTAMFSQNKRNTYLQNWKQVESFTKKSLPKSALQEVDVILDEATKEKNIPQIMKAYVFLAELKAQIDDQSVPEYFSQLEDLLKKTESPVDKALLHSSLAIAYKIYYENREWLINRKTDLADDIVPDDIEEWTKNTFANKIYEHLEASILNNKQALLEDSPKAYEDIIELGADSRTYRPTLYDFIMYENISVAQTLQRMESSSLMPVGFTLDQLLLPATDFVKLQFAAQKSDLIFRFYQQYFADLLDRKMTSSVILLEIDKLKFLSSTTTELTTERLIATLENLTEIYKDNQTTAEIINYLVDVMGIQNDWVPVGYREIDQNFNSQNEELLRKKTQERVEWLKKGIAAYAKYPRIGTLENKLMELETPSLELQGNSIYSSSDSVVLDVTHKNNQSLKKKTVINLYRVEGSKQILVKSIATNYISKDVFYVDKSTLNLGKLPYGKYIVVSTFNEKDSNRPSLSFVVSDLTTYYVQTKELNYNIFVVDRKNGKPIEGATVNVVLNGPKQEKETKTLTTNDQGFCRLDNVVKSSYSRTINYDVAFGEDKSLPKVDFRQSYYSGNLNSGQEQKKQTVYSIFADRSIYRPGQIVYFKEIVFDQDSKPIVKHKNTIMLLDPNGNELSRKELVTNDFGSSADHFVLPKNTLPGTYWLQIDGGTRLYFQVEEYKRPTFEIKFDTLKTTYTFGDKVLVSGNVKSYSGISLQNTDVKFNIYRSEFMLWRWYGGNKTLFEEGVVKTTDDGSFEIEFTPSAGDMPTWRANNLYSFMVNVEVTDLNGETQSAQQIVNVGDVSMIWEITMPSKIEKSQDLNFTIGAKNLNNFSLETKGNYAIYTVGSNDSVDVKLIEGTFVTGEQTELASRIKTLTSGKMRLLVSGKDDKGRDVKGQADFVLFSYDDKRPPYETNTWFEVKAAQFEGEKPAEVIFGTSNSDSYVLYRLYNDSTIFECKFIKFDNENQTFVIPYRSEFGEGVYVAYALMKNGQLDEKSILLTKSEEKENKDGALKVKVNVFRDKLRPGDTASWTLDVSDAEGKPISAEVLASMYDISLDQLYPFSKWVMSRPYINKYYPTRRDLQSVYLAKEYYNVNLDYKTKQVFVKNWDFDRYKYFFNEAIYPQNEIAIIGYGGMKRNTFTGKAVPPMLKSSRNLSEAVAIADGNIDMAESADEKETDEPSASNLEIRKNFNETAFFYPQLKTDKEGVVSVSFTVPEQTTTWRFRAFAYDKEGQVGTLEKMVTTSKELQITPNMPRFIRQGDMTNISTKISNLSEGALTGNVSIEFFNVIDEKVIKLKLKDAKQKFSLEAGASSSASWSFEVPTDMDMLGVRIVAHTSTFSDGEQHALVVLPSRMLITESMPVDVTKVGEQSFTMDKLLDAKKSETLDNFRLVFEFSSNPTWYAVQAMPTLNSPIDDNVISQIGSYYVNAMGRHILSKYPEVKSVIKSWLAESENGGTLTSKLDDNEDLKNILLSETPWVLDAKNETAQMRNLSLLLDDNNIRYQLIKATEKLKDLQNENGGWSWYKGMYANRSMTQYILFVFDNLKSVTGEEYSGDVNAMLEDALKYVDAEMLMQYQQLKEYNKDWKNTVSVSTSDLEYLLVRSKYSNVKLSKENQEVFDFYSKIAFKNWTKLNVYEKSLLAILANRNGEKTLAKEVLTSIEEHATISDELGMYWANNHNRVFVSMSAVSTHLFIMEAFREVGTTTEKMDMMNRWLVKQKQTAAWETTNATIHAIGMLLSEGTNWLKDDSMPEIKVGKTVLKPEEKALGTGYFKNTWPASEVKPSMAKVTIVSENTKPAYGALYWQYYEELDKVGKQDGALNISKELYKEQINEKGKVLVKITEEAPLKVGDKVVVRLVVRADRDMEFVQLKDMRAACFEPVNSRSGMVWNGGNAVYYQAVKDASTNLYFDVLPRGTYVIEYQVYVNRIGEYKNGITTLQSAYAPEFVSHTAGIKVTVEE